MTLAFDHDLEPLDYTFSVPGGWCSVVQHENGFEARVKGGSLGVFRDEDDVFGAAFDYYNPPSNGGDNPHKIQEDDAPAAAGDDSDEQVEGHICAQCQLPPDGSERLSAYNDEWLHPRCEEALAATPNQGVNLTRPAPPHKTWLTTNKKVGL